MNSSPYGDINPQTWGELLAVGAFWAATSESLPEFLTLLEGGSTVATSLESHILLAAQTAAAEASGGEVVARMGSEIQKFIGALPGQKDAGEAAILAALDDAATKLSPEDPFAAMYRRWEAEAAALYGEAWQEPAAFALRTTFGHPRAKPPADLYAVDAQTGSPADGRGVTIRLRRNKITSHVWAVLPRLLSHELICHVGAADPDSPNSLSEFAEGFMDDASMQYLARWLPDLEPGLHQAALGHAVLSDPSFAASDPGSRAARCLGRKAVHILVEQCDPASDRRRAIIADLGVDLNACSTSRERKDEFVARVRNRDLRADTGPLSEVLEGRRSPEDVL